MRDRSLATVSGARLESRDVVSDDRVPWSRGWLITSLLFCFMLVNYADRAVLGLAAEPVMRDFGLQPSQFGLIGSAFFFSYCGSGLLFGFLLDRFRTKYLLIGFAVIWSLAQFPMIFAGHFGVLLASRVLLGLGEGPAYAAALHAVYRWFPDSRRAMPGAVITQGSAAGVIFAAPLLSLVIVHFGWQSAFFVLGVVGILWAAVWAWFGADGPITSTITPAGEALARVPYRALLLNPTVICTCLLVFAAYWALAIMLVWFPNFLRAGLGFSPVQAGSWASLPWIVAVIVILGSGLASQSMTRRGFSSRAARVYLLCGLSIFGAICLAGVAYLSDPIAKLALATVGIALPNAVFAPAQAIFGEICPVRQRGAVLSISNAVAATAGMLAPYATGLMVEKSSSALAGYETAFVLAGAVVFVANVVGLVFIRPERQVARLAARSA